MAKEKEAKTCCESKGNPAAAGAGAVWCLGFIGALVYFIQHASSFGAGLLGVLKALVWPALVVYQLLSFLKL
jgi:hypothetical protein